MTTMMTSSLFGLDDMEALLWGPSYLTADPMEPLLLRPDRDGPEGGPTSASEGGVSPVSSLSSSSSSSSSPPPFYSPPPSPPITLLQEDKAEAEPDLLSLPWLNHPGLSGQSHSGTDGGKEDMFCDLDWMTERVDLSEFDLDSLIGSCGPDGEPPSSPEDLLASLDCSMELESLPASLDCPMELDSLPLPILPSLPSASPQSDTALNGVPTELSFPPTVETVSLIDGQEVCSPPPCVPWPQEELEIKSEPVSPAPSSPPPPSSPSVHSPPSPAYTLDLGSEVDISECEVKPVVTTVIPEVKSMVATVIPQVPRIVISLSPTRIVLLLAPKDEVRVTTTTPEIIRSSPTPSTSSAPARSRPYPNPKSRPGPTSPTTTGVKVQSPRGPGTGERGASKAPRDKKIKKMEQNKTAATRYRQKKRAENDKLGTEYSELEKRNIELNEKAESMAREIQYLKELMEEVRLTRIKKVGADL